MFRSLKIKDKANYFYLVLFIFLLDQATKIYTMKSLYYGEVVPVIEGNFHFVYYLNMGAAFGILSTWGIAGKLLLSSISLVAFLILSWLIIKSTDKLTTFTYALIAGGAVGNLYDRALREGVVDFLEFCLAGRCWPAFNVADSCITVGVCILAYILFKEGKEELTHSKSQSPPPPPSDEEK